jgi:hypothetical protein
MKNDKRHHEQQQVVDAAAAKKKTGPKMKTVGRMVCVTRKVDHTDDNTYVPSKGKKAKLSFVFETPKKGRSESDTHFV